MNAKLNFGFSQIIQTHNLALSNENKEGYLLADSGFGAYQSGGAKVDTKGEMKITQIRGDDLIKDTGNMIAIKIDVEGHEYEVLKGSEQVITSNQPVIMFEQFPDEFKNGSSKVLDLLKTMGYKKFVVMERSPNFQIKYKILKIPTPINNILNMTGTD